MTWRPLSLLWIFLAGLPRLAAAQPSFQHPEPIVAQPILEGQRLARALRSAFPETDGQFSGTLKTRDRDGSVSEVPIRWQITVGETNWQSLYLIGPTATNSAEGFLILHSLGQTNQYFRLPRGTNGTPIPLPGGQAILPLGGSDFNLTDLGMDYLHWPEQRLLKIEMRKGRWCQVLESKHAPANSNDYARVVSWVDREHGQPLLAEAYDEANRLIKEFSLGSVKKIDGQWQVQDVKIRNLPDRSRTWLEFDLK